MSSPDSPVTNQLDVISLCGYAKSVKKPHVLYKHLMLVTFYLLKLQEIKLAWHDEKLDILPRAISKFIN